MATQKELYELVHSLDKNEKKHVSLMINALGGKGRDRYAYVFDTINKQKDYDEAKLKLKLARGVSGMNLSEANNYVYDFICKAVISYLPGQNLGYSNHLKFIEFLINKKLLDSGHKQLQKLIPELESAGSHSQLLRAYELQEFVTIQHPGVNADYGFRSRFFEKRLTAIKNQLQNVEILQLQYRFHKAAKEVGQPRTKAQLKPFEELWENPLLNYPLEKIERSSIVPYLLMKISLAAALYKPEAYQIAVDAVKFIQTNFKEKSFENREANLLNTLLTLMITQPEVNYGELQWATRRMREIKKSNQHPVIWQQREAKIIMAELSYYLKRKQYKKATAYFEQIIKPEVKDTWTGSLVNYAVPWMGARLYFLDRNPDKALDCLLMIQGQEKTMSPNVFIDYKFLSLMCHYKQENHSLVISTADSLYKRLRKTEKLYAPEKAMLSFVKSSGTIEKMKLNMRRLYDTFRVLKKDPFNSSFFLYSDYIEWLKMELEK